MILRTNRHTQAGFGAFAYILMSIALLAALTTAISVGGRNNTRVQNNDILVSKIYGQASKIRSDILLCMTEVQVQDNIYSPLAFRRFPICDADEDDSVDWNDTYTNDAYCSDDGGNIRANAARLRCITQGANSVWDNSEGNFFPDRIPSFEPWKYAIMGSGDYEGVSLLITTEGRATSVDTDWVLRKVRDKFGPNEAQVLIRAGDDTASGELNVGECAANNLCNTIQIWLAK